jgi:hypothetical protein
LRTPPARAARPVWKQGSFKKVRARQTAYPPRPKKARFYDRHHIAGAVCGAIKVSRPAANGNRRVGTCHDQGEKPWIVTKMILVKAVTRGAAVQKITGALGGVVREAELEAALANCRALINQIDAGLSVKKLFLNISSAAELLFYLEFAASALKTNAKDVGKAQLVPCAQVVLPIDGFINAFVFLESAIAKLRAQGVVSDRALAEARKVQAT